MPKQQGTLLYVVETRELKSDSYKLMNNKDMAQPQSRGHAGIEVKFDNLNKAFYKHFKLRHIYFLFTN